MVASLRNLWAELDSELLEDPDDEAQLIGEAVYPDKVFR